MVRPTLARVALLLAVTVGLGATLALARPALAAGLSFHAKDKRAPHAEPAVQMDSAAVVERYGAAVVSIGTAPPGQPDPAPTLASIGPDDPFVPFFKRETPQPPPAISAQARPSWPAFSVEPQPRPSPWIASQ